MIVLREPYVDSGLCLFGGVEPLSVQDLMAKRSVEPFVVSVLPGRAGIDLDWFNSDLCQPDLQRTSDELSAIVRTNILGLSVPSIAEFVMDEVDAPDMIGVLRS